MSYFRNPISIYLKWFLGIKIKYDLFAREHRANLGYLVELYHVKLGVYNWVGDNTIIRNSSLGDFTYIASDANISDTTIGKFCSIGPNVRSGPGKHPTRVIVSTHPSLYSKPQNIKKGFHDCNHFKYLKDVVIGNDVWIGANAVLANGITIGDGAVVAANSLVVKDVPPYAIVSGVPAQVIKYRFDEGTRSFLLEFKWWNNDIDWITKNKNTFLSITEFMEKFAKS